MRRFAFIIAILGMFVLVLLLNLPPKQISSPEQLQALEINQKVSLQGKVISERIIYQNKKLLTLNNEIELTCECPETLKDKDIQVLGLIEEYKGKKQVKVTRLQIN